MTIEQVRLKVEAIRQIAGDNEDAHFDEDELWRHVLEAIAAGAQDAQGLATEALKTREIEFTRWYA